MFYRSNDSSMHFGLACSNEFLFKLPLSFMASFLALDVAQFPWDGDKLPLNWVIKIIRKSLTNLQPTFR